MSTVRKRVPSVSKLAPSCPAISKKKTKPVWDVGKKSLIHYSNFKKIDLY